MESFLAESVPTFGSIRGIDVIDIVTVRYSIFGQVVGLHAGCLDVVVP